ncbi:MAG TPA: glycosyltransferase family 39 protein [Xanthobacteraceae bacterium]
MIAARCRYLRAATFVIDAFDLATALLMATLLVLVLATFTEYAISNDEGVQHQYGELIIAYYKSGFADRSVFDFQNLYLYGGLFDIIAVLLAHLFPFDPYDIRHLMSALAGLGGIAATSATARMIAGPRAGLLAGLALAVCGVWYGGMFNHTKDVPFAAAMMGATYYLMRGARDLPHLRRRDTLLFGLLLGAALGLRATGLLMVGYLGPVIALAAWTTAKPDWRAAAHLFARSLMRFIPALALAYIIMIVSWPWASLDLFNPVRAIFAFAHFHYPVRTVMDGTVYLMSDVPRWYEPEYLAIKVPLIVLIGAGAAALSAAWSAASRAGRTGTLEVAILLFTIVFPLTCQVIGHGPSFTGMRHFLFVLPPLTALAGIGVQVGLSYFERRGRMVGGAALAAVTVAFGFDATALVRLHPYEYLFYNSLVGGLPGASRRYATDYWVNIMPAAVKDLEAYLDATDHGVDPLRLRQFTVGVCGERVSFENEADRRLRWTSDWDHADFFIAPTHMNCDQVLRGKVVDVIERLGVPIGVVKDLRGLSPQARWAPVEVAHGPPDSADAHASPHG